MARLRKASPLEPSISVTRAESTRPKRSSPRKVVREISYVISSDEDGENIPLRPKSSKRDLGDASSIFQEDSFYSSRSYATPPDLVFTPHRQRILRPVESNSRLLRKLSDASLASPEKRLGSERRLGRDASETNKADVERRSNFMYARSLVRSMAGRELNKGNSRADKLGGAEQSELKTSQEKMLSPEVCKNESDTQEETSILCIDQMDVARKVGGQAVNEVETRESGPEKSPKEDGTSEEEDNDIFPPARMRHRQTRRCIESDSESDEEQETEAEESKDEVAEQEKVRTEVPQSPLPMRPPHRKGNNTILNWAEEVVDLTDSPHASDSFILSESTRARSSSFAVSRPATSSSESAHPFLTHSPTPTKKRSPRKIPPISRAVTPPLARPSPTKLVSPSKKKVLVTSALDLQPSLDAFWNPEIVNNYNDRQSPAKTLVSPRKQQWRDNTAKLIGGMDLEAEDSSDGGFASPIRSSKKKPARSHTTRREPNAAVEPTVKEVRALRKDFDARKHAIAANFLAELDDVVCSGRISELSRATGGIKVVWSNTLKTTAGRANWRREVIRLKSSSSPPTYTSETRHHCSIELASKVIDDSSRLYNVLAHEFCHLLTFMISEVRNNPHGAEFKAWGRKVSTAFAAKGVDVTTKHSYAIEYKFVWECVSCGYEFKRHSRSVDTERHSCGKCKGRLVQTKPVPRARVAGKNGDHAKRSDYQVFVKENFKRVKEDMATQGLDTPMGKVMEVVAKQYRERKGVTESQSEQTVVDTLDGALAGLQL